MPECPDCERGFIGDACPRCGWKAPASGKPASKMPSVCPADGARLQADGWCPTGNGYLAHMSCPFVCPICRQPLSWDGGCEHCHGCTTGAREDWTFPGDRYELEAGHWRKILAGPRRACTQEENAAGARTLGVLLAAAPVLALRSPHNGAKVGLIHEAPEAAQAEGVQRRPVGPR